MSDDEGPFTGLPAALVEQMLEKTTEAGEKLLESFQNAKNSREDNRAQLKDKELILKESFLDIAHIPTTCATDGSYAIERLLTVDMIAAAAVAVEGLTPPSDKRFWEQPHHHVIAHPEPHDPKTATILRAAMIGEELLLACKAPHDLVMLDTTLTLPIIYFNQAISESSNNTKLKISEQFLCKVMDYLEAYYVVLTCPRSDKQFIGVPKYSTRKEISSEMGWDHVHDDRGLLTLILESGELTKPAKLESPESKWHIGVSGLASNIKNDAQDLVNNITSALENVHVFYYKPHDWLPALRVEVASNIGLNRSRLAVVIQGLKHQCPAASILEPYPLYLADRTVKALSKSMPAFRQVASQKIAESYDGDIGDVFFSMHGYRSEGGR